VNARKNSYKNNLSDTKINAKITGRQAYAQFNEACLGLVDVVNTPLERGEVGLYDEGSLDWHSRNGGEIGAG